ncbi:hypothetical protein AWENTII_007144 [Aspergillus wentii]
MADVLEHNVRTIIAAQCRVPLEKVTLDADINRDLGGDMDTMAWLLVRLQQVCIYPGSSDNANEAGIPPGLYGRRCHDSHRRRDCPVYQVQVSVNTINIISL